MHALGSVHSTSEKLISWLSGTRESQCPDLGFGPGTTDTGYETLVRPYQLRARGYWEADISLVIGINQTNHSTNQERPCTTVHRIKKELSICPSQLRPDLVTFPVLSN